MKRDFSQLYALLEADADTFRVLWSAQDVRTRRVLLKIAGRSELLADLSWDQLKPETRHAIKARSADLRDWLNRVLGEPVKVAA